MRTCYCTHFDVIHSVACTELRKKTPLIQINSDDEPSGYAQNPDDWIFFWEIGYFSSLKFGCYYLQYIPASKTFEVLETIKLYCT